MRPDDLAWPGFNLDDAWWGDEDANPYELQDGTRPRATAMSLYAREEGVRWVDVLCRRVWARPLTRQESWDSGAGERFLDDKIGDWADSLGLRYDLRLNQWRDVGGVVFEPPELSKEVPPLWRPDEEDPSWTFCERTHPLAVPGWRCEA